MVITNYDDLMASLSQNDLDNIWKDGRPHVVLISGKAGVGKTTFAGLLSRVVHENEDHKSVVMTHSIAWGVKQAATNMGWNGEKDVAGRRLLQGIGKIGREFNIDVWVEIANKGITDTHYHFGSFEDKGLRYVWIDDWRFRNEAKWFKEMDYLYRLLFVRVIAPSREILKGTPEALDVSEVDLDDYAHFDVVIDNERTMDDLYENAKMVYNILNKTED